MPNLKDIRVRIGSVKTTRQVTSAMKMVSAAKFKKAHDKIIAFRPYVSKLEMILSSVVSSMEEGFDSVYSASRDANRVLMVVITSNRGLCGAFNSNVVKLAEKTISNEFQSQLRNGFLDVMVIGKQGGKMMKSHGYNVVEEHNELFTNADYAACSDISQMLMDKFVSGEYDRILLVYNKFVNAAVQDASVLLYLPLELPTGERTLQHDFIFEPEKKSIIDSIVPKALKTEFFGCVLESVAAEHGARMTSMHKATDNATELLHDLQLVYNKARQAAITNEILEIVGGAEAQKK